MPDVAIREARTIDDILDMSAVIAAVWGDEGVPAVNVLRAVQHAGGYLALAEDGGRTVAASMGFLGRHEDGELLLHSHITGTLPGLGNRGIGYAIKQHQRAWCLDRGIGTIAWTFDPLVRRNAWFNLTKLGAEATEYHADFYGEMGDALNAGDETDRLVATWRLKSDRTVDRDAPEGAVLALDIDAGGAPLVLGGNAPVLLHKVPASMPDGDARRAWRHAVRESLGAAIQSGYVGTGVTTDGAYVLRRP